MTREGNDVVQSHEYDGLVVVAVWEPKEAGTDSGSITWLADSSRRRWAIFSIIPAVVLVAVFWLLAAPLVVVVSPVLAAGIVSVWLGQSGRSGFYTTKADGSPGAFLGRTRPDLADMVKRRP